MWEGLALFVILARHPFLLWNVTPRRYNRAEEGKHLHESVCSLAPPETLQLKRGESPFFPIHVCGCNQGTTQAGLVKCPQNIPTEPPHRQPGCIITQQRRQV